MTLLAAEQSRPQAIALLDTGLPASVRGIRGDIALERGIYSGEEMYGRFEGVRQRQDSLLALTERRRGLPVPPPRCPVLVVASDWDAEGQQKLAKEFGAEFRHFAGLNHGTVVTRREVIDEVLEFLFRHIGQTGRA